MDRKSIEEREALKTAVEALDTPEPADQVRREDLDPIDSDAATGKAESEPPAAANSDPSVESSAEVGTLKSDPLPPEELERLTADIVAALKTVHDPEIPSDIYELGLIYKVEIDDDRNVAIDMTLTAPGCPVAGEMPGWVENAVNAVPGVAGTKVTIVFDPPWDQSRMSDEAKLAVGMF